MAEGDSKRVGVSILGVVVGAPLSYVVQRFLEAWGVLDDISDAAGKFFKTHVPPATAGWTIALLIVGSLYAFLLWSVWRRPRHIHHVDPAPEKIGIGDAVDAEIVRPRQGGSRMAGIPFPSQLSNEELAKAGQAVVEQQAKELKEKEQPARNRASEREKSKRSAKQLASAMDDDLKEQDERARLLAASLLSPRKAAQVNAGKYRDVSIYEALGWAMYAEWDRPYTGFMGIAVMLGPKPDPWKFLSRIVELALEGKLTIWGKRAAPGYIEEIPSSYWEEHGLELAHEHPLVPLLVTSDDDDPYRDLELNSDEVEAAWPHQGSPPR